MNNFLKQGKGFTQHFLFFCRKKESAGFTLVETLVAITILLLSIVGPMTIAANGLFSAYYSRDQITAYYLAQEGIEFVRGYRDSLYLNDYYGGASDVPVGSLAWLGYIDSSEVGELSKCFPDTVWTIDLGIEAPSGIGGGCTADITADPSLAIMACNEECRVLEYDPTSYIYGYDLAGGEDSKFTRTITVTPRDNDGDSDNGIDFREAVVKSEVKWVSGATEKTFTLYEILFNWQRD